jgi:hypothetical protein
MKKTRRDHSTKNLIFWVSCAGAKSGSKNEEVFRNELEVSIEATAEISKKIMVGASRFERPTSCSQGRRANQSALRPDISKYNHQVPNPK